MSKGLTLNPLTGRLKLTTVGELFSIKRILSDESKEIPSNRQMLLHGSLRNDGTLKNLGEIILITLEDKEKVLPKLAELVLMNKETIKQRYRELRKSGSEAHHKGGGIGFYEITKRSDKLSYEFEQISEKRYYFRMKAIIKTQGKALI